MNIKLCCVISIAATLLMTKSSCTSLETDHSMHQASNRTIEALDLEMPRRYTPGDLQKFQYKCGHADDTLIEKLKACGIYKYSRTHMMQPIHGGYDGEGEDDFEGDHFKVFSDSESEDSSGQSIVQEEVSTLDEMLWIEDPVFKDTV